MNARLPEANQAYVDLAGRVDEITQRGWDKLAEKAEDERNVRFGASMQVYDVNRPKGKILCIYLPELM